MPTGTANAASDIIGGFGGALGSWFGSDAPPKAILNRYAAPTAKASRDISTNLLKDVDLYGKTALDQYLGMQPKFMDLAGQQEGVLGNLMNRQLNYDPNAALQQTGNTLFGFINPNVINPLSQADVNRGMVERRARGLNSAAIDSSAERLRNARIASQRYYDVANNVYNVLPNVYGQGFNQQQAAMASAAGYIPQIAGAYESVASRPFTGMQQRIGTTQAALGAGGTGIANVNAATQGYRTPQNWADRLAAGSGELGRSVGGVLSFGQPQMPSSISL